MATFFEGVFLFVAIFVHAAFRGMREAIRAAAATLNFNFEGVHRPSSHVIVGAFYSVALTAAKIALAAVLGLARGFAESVQEDAARMRAASRSVRKH